MVVLEQSFLSFAVVPIETLVALQGQGGEGLMQSPSLWIRIVGEYVQCGLKSSKKILVTFAVVKFYGVVCVGNEIVVLPILSAIRCASKLLEEAPN